MTVRLVLSVCMKTSVPELLHPGSVRQDQHSSLQKTSAAVMGKNREGRLRETQKDLRGQLLVKFLSTRLHEQAVVLKANKGVFYYDLHYNKYCSVIRCKKRPFTLSGAIESMMSEI
ncbi:hypothetical protein CHARACLAT_027097 [Characodon lateralis]|uniref:Uncharacterized protein n=1 Tax=Characodon lateralis TaxID=208331 RepID=A0ABU7DAD2_9TELE|nr:hypothetical protein [Characodon lateralis]